MENSQAISGLHVSPCPFREHLLYHPLNIHHLVHETFPQPKSNCSIFWLYYIYYRGLFINCLPALKSHFLNNAYSSQQVLKLCLKIWVYKVKLGCCEDPLGTIWEFSSIWRCMEANLQHNHSFVPVRSTYAVQIYSEHLYKSYTKA